jgi:hypothetical protein
MSVVWEQLCLMSFCKRNHTSHVISMHVEHSVIPVIWKLNVSVWPAVIVTNGFLSLTVCILFSLLLIVCLPERMLVFKSSFSGMCNGHSHVSFV